MVTSFRKFPSYSTGDTQRVVQLQPASLSRSNYRLISTLNLYTYATSFWLAKMIALVLLFINVFQWPKRASS